jgi:FtsP/CotA-like multicopper oxidase with cupredoxin domain
MGLAGLYILKSESDVDGQLPNGCYDIPLMLQDRAFTNDGELEYDHDSHHGAVGKVMLVNAAPVRLALSTRQPLVQIATDQGLLPSPVASVTTSSTRITA